MVFGIDDAAFATIASAAIGAAANGASAVANSKLNKKNRQWQEKMYQWQLADQRADTESARAYQLALIDQQNRYASPENQVKLLKEAGLNPALAYSGNTTGATSSVAGGQATQAAPTPGNPSTFGYDFSGIGQAASDALKYSIEQQRVKNETSRVNSENALRQADAILKAKQAGQISEEVAGIRLDNLFKEMSFEDRLQAISLQNDETVQKINKVISDMSVNDMQKKEMQARIDTFHTSIEQMNAEIMNTMADTTLKGQQTQLTVAQEEYYHVLKNYQKEMNALVIAKMKTEEQLKRYYQQMQDESLSREELNKVQTAYTSLRVDWYNYETIMHSINQLMNGAAAGAEAVVTAKGGRGAKYRRGTSSSTIDYEMSSNNMEPAEFDRIFPEIYPGMPLQPPTQL